jgi:hypothetical protein
MRSLLAIVLGLASCGESHPTSPFSATATAEVQSQFLSVCGPPTRDPDLRRFESAGADCGITLYVDEADGRITMVHLQLGPNLDMHRFHEVAISTILPLLRSDARRAVERLVIVPGVPKLVVDQRLPGGGRISYLLLRGDTDRPYADLTVSNDHK